MCFILSFYLMCQIFATLQVLLGYFMPFPAVLRVLILYALIVAYLIL